jgi:hypothetical protein
LVHFLLDYELDSEEMLVSTTTGEPLPFFDESLNLTNVTAPLGSTVFLHCRVNLLKDKTVRTYIIHTFLRLILLTQNQNHQTYYFPQKERKLLLPHPSIILKVSCTQLDILF